MSEQAAGPQRRSPLDNLTPADFVAGGWPHGRLVVPAEAFRTYGLTRDQARAHLRAVRDLRQLVLDYEKYLKVKNTTQLAFSARIGVSVNRLSALRSGTAWPSWRLAAVLRSAVPAAEVLERGRTDGDLDDQ
ncbi:helix-turn-helix domain-containing protein [Nocardioidaceae bacterium]|nr:helix-turn-helix domain-containing protein [Nocardioidaceae bacterium]